MIEPLDEPMGKPTNGHRPDARATVTTLTAGTVIAVVVFVVAFVLRLTGEAAFADTVSTLAVVALLVTPAAALIATAIELRPTQRTAAGLAIVVLLVLAAATLLALLVPRP